jgi:hypothetical protein
VTAERSNPTQQFEALGLLVGRSVGSDSAQETTGRRCVCELDMRPRQQQRRARAFGGRRSAGQSTTGVLQGVASFVKHSGAEQHLAPLEEAQRSLTGISQVAQCQLGRT